MRFEEDWYGAYSTCLSGGYVYEGGGRAGAELVAEMNGDTLQRRRQPSHGKLRL